MSIRQQNQGPDLSSVSNTQITKAVDFGTSFSNNVSFATRQFGNNIRAGSPEFVHYQFLKPRQGVQQLNEAALTGAFAAQQLESRGKCFLTF